LVGTLLIVLEFGSSERLASAYGLAVSGAMVITAVLFFQVVSQESGAKRWLRWLLIAGFLAIDLIFWVESAQNRRRRLAAVIDRRFDFPVTEHLVSGRELLSDRQQMEKRPAVPDFLAQLHSESPVRVKGTAVELIQGLNEGEASEF
jgi:KUP system potassium uptake protein